VSEAVGLAEPMGEVNVEPPVRVALYSGIVVPRDAVSRSLVHKLEALRRVIGLGAPMDVTVFAQSIDEAEPEFRLVPSVAELLARDEFWDADVHVFEEGMYYDLFNSVFVIPPDRPIMAIEHNSTPPELVDVPGARVAVERSHAQRHNLTLARHVACVSELNVEMARSVGVPDDKISVLHLPPGVTPGLTPRPMTEHEGPIRLLYLGRFVRAKGIVDMLELTERLATRGDGRFSVTLAGDPRFSDPALMDAMLEKAAAARGLIDVALAPDDATMAELFERTDALVIPSYHEGYCVPVIEAYGFGRFVIAYDAGNLPNIVAGLGLLVETGNVDALEAAVLRFADALEAARSGATLRLPTTHAEMTLDEWAEAVRSHLRGYSAANFERQFLGLMRDLIAASPAGLGTKVDRALSARIAELAGVD
jgi:glycosyltransferase involved in cell wall biosynthesis